MKCVWLILIAVFVLMPRWTTKAIAETCPQTLAPAEAVVMNLKDMYTRGQLTVQDLIAIRNGKNPLETKRGVDGRTFSDVISNTISQLKENPSAQTQIDELIAVTQRQELDQKKNIRDTSVLFAQVHFLDVQRGTFLMGRDPNSDNYTQHQKRQADEQLHEVEITHDFRIADAPITQWQYAMVTNNNPSEFSKGSDSLDLVIEGRRMDMQPNHPVENVSWYDANRFIKQLNIWSHDNDPRIYKIMPNHIPYAEIFLPTEAEWEYVARNRGRWQGPFPDGVTEENIREFAWYNLNTGDDGTRPVRELNPLLLDGDKPIYDLLGNVQEWTADQYHPMFASTYQLLEKTTTDKAVVWPKSSRICRGGYWHVGAIEHLRLSQRSGGDPKKQDKYTGFRIIEIAP